MAKAMISEHESILIGIIRSKKQETDVGKYPIINRTIQFWNQLPADALRTLSCKPSNFRELLGK
jgi:hypothetical protein